MWKPKHLGVDREFYLMFLSRDIKIKLCQSSTKIYMYKMLDKIVGLNRSCSANTQPILKRQYPSEA